MKYVDKTILIGVNLLQKITTIYLNKKYFHISKKDLMLKSLIITISIRNSFLENHSLYKVYCIKNLKSKQNI
jgi:hypothetical protein